MVKDSSDIKSSCILYNNLKYKNIYENQSIRFEQEGTITLRQFDYLISSGNNIVDVTTKKFEDNFFLKQLKNIKGLEYILPGSKKNQKDIIRFVNYCKSFEGSNGYLMSTFFDNLKTKYAEFLSGPFTNMIFEIISEQKNKLKILIGNSVATIEKSKYHYQSC